MKKYLEKTLHTTVRIENSDHHLSFPLILKSKYELKEVWISGKKFLFVKPNEKMNLTTLRKHYKMFGKYSQDEIVFFFNKLNSYTKDRLIAEKMSFVVKDSQIYLPSLALSLKEEKSEILNTPVKVSSITQKLLITAIYEKWSNMSVTEAAENLGISKMSVTRIYNELTGLDLPVIKRDGRSRLFFWQESTEELWQLLLPYLQNPVKRVFSIKAIPDSVKKRPAGLTALSQMTMLEDNHCPAYAITTSQIRDVEILSTADGEEPEAVIQVWSYEIKRPDNLDPLSVILSLGNDDREDPRIQKELDFLLKEIFND